MIVGFRVYEQSSLQLDAKVSCVNKAGVGELCSLMEYCLISGFGWSRRKFRMAQGSDALRYLMLFLHHCYLMRRLSIE